MGSSFDAFCVSHDPALSMELGRATAEDAIHLGREAHPRCDLLIGRYSGALVEVGCPSSPDLAASRVHPGYHPHSTQWVDAGWLRLALTVLSLPSEHPGVEQALSHVTRLCWQPSRIERLRPFLEP